MGSIHGHFHFLLNLVNWWSNGEEWVWVCQPHDDLSRVHRASTSNINPLTLSCAALCHSPFSSGCNRCGLCQPPIAMMDVLWMCLLQRTGGLAYESVVREVTQSRALSPDHMQWANSNTLLTYMLASFTHDRRDILVGAEASFNICLFAVFTTVGKI